MKLTKRRVTVGLISTAVVVTMTGVSTWALAGETTKAAPSAPVRLIVGYKNGADPAAATKSMSAFGARGTATAADEQALKPLNATTVEVSSSRKASLISSLRSDPNVAYVEVDHQRKISDTTPNDPFYTGNKQPEVNEVKLPTAWDKTTGDSAVKIAVIDTGVNAVGDLSGAVDAGFDFVNNDSSAADDEGHGSSVASLVAARGNNSAGMAGVCWQCRIIPVKVLDSKGEGYDSDIAKGITWAVQHGAKVLNMSLGGDQPSQALADAVAYANMNSVLVVVAAGNEGNTVRQYPAALGDVLAVAATNRCPQFATDPTCTTGTDRLVSWSSRNSNADHWVDVAAPGIVGAMDRNGNYSTGVQGTSFSSPIVAGIAGLVKSYHPNYTGWALMNAIQRSATFHPLTGGGVNYGKVDAGIALQVGTETVPPTSSGISPAQGTWVHGTFNVVPVKIADNFSGIRNVVLYADGVYKGYSRTSPYSVAYNSAGRNGTVKLQLRIYDKAGNQTVLDRLVSADNVNPTVKITKTPTNNSKVSGTQKVYYSGSDKNGIKLYQLIVDGAVRQSHTSASAPFTFNGSAYGSSMTVQVRAYDKANNIALSTKYTYKH